MYAFVLLITAAGVVASPEFAITFPDGPDNNDRLAHTITFPSSNADPGALAASACARRPDIAPTRCVPRLAAAIAGVIDAFTNAEEQRSPPNFPLQVNVPASDRFVVQEAIGDKVVVKLHWEIARADDGLGGTAEGLPEALFPGWRAGNATHNRTGYVAISSNYREEEGETGQALLPGTTLMHRTKVMASFIRMTIDAVGTHIFVIRAVAEDRVTPLSDGGAILFHTLPKAIEGGSKPNPGIPPPNSTICVGSTCEAEAGAATTIIDADTLPDVVSPPPAAGPIKISFFTEVGSVDGQLMMFLAQAAALLDAPPAPGTNRVPYDIDFVDLTCKHATPGHAYELFRALQGKIRARGGTSLIIHDCPSGNQQTFHVPLRFLGDDIDGIDEGEKIQRMVRWVKGLWTNSSSIVDARERYLNAFGVFHNPDTGTWEDWDNLRNATENARLAERTQAQFKTMGNIVTYMRGRDVLVFAGSSVDSGGLGARGMKNIVFHLSHFARSPVTVVDVAAKGPFVDDEDDWQSALRRVDAVLSPSWFVARHPKFAQRLKRAAVSARPPPVYVVPPGVDVDVYDFAIARRETGGADAAINDAGTSNNGVIAGEALHVVYLGRIAPAKGFGLFFGAAAALLQTRARDPAALPPLRFSLVGGARTREWTDVTRGVACANFGLCPPVLNITGRVPHAAVIAALASADVVVFPSVYPESFGIVNLEAMAAGVPVVSFAAGGASDFTVHGDNALVVPLAGAETPALLARAIGRLARDASLRAAIGRAGRATVLERFTAARAADRYRRVFAAVIARKMGAVMEKRRREKHGGG